MIKTYLQECTFLYELFQFSVFLIYFDEDKKLIIKEVEPGAYLIKTEGIKKLILDSNEVSDELAYELLSLLKDSLKTK